MVIDVTWECKPRTVVKLQILDEYLSVWFTILGNHGYRRAIYIDTFCGPGVYSTGEDGSPVIALKCGKSAHSKYANFKPEFHFIDASPNSIAHLESLPKFKKIKKQLKKVSLYNGTFASLATNVIQQAKIRQATPIFSFVDPFGVGVSPFITIKKLLPNKHSEMFINFMGGWANRFINHSDQLATHVEGLLGGNFVERVINSSNRTEEIYKIYEKQLKTIVPYVKRFQLYDEGGQKDNALIFCSHHIKGFVKMKEVMWKIDPIHGCQFSERSHNAKSDLFGLLPDEPYLHPLKKKIVKNFAGRSKVEMSEIDSWVETETEYLTKHLRKTGGLMETLYIEGNIKYFDKQGKHKAKNNWPKRLLIDFL